MAFWSVQGGEPLRQYRWYITFTGGDLAGISYALKKADKPKAKINTVQHKYLNHFFNYPGRLEWEDINITFAAVTEPNASKALYNVLSNAGYGVPKDAFPGASMSSIGKTKFNTAIGDSMKLFQLDAEGAGIETWSLHRPFFTSVQFGTLDYGSEEIVEITCGVKYDWATLSANDTTTEGSVGSNPGFPS